MSPLQWIFPDLPLLRKILLSTHLWSIHRHYTTKFITQFYLFHSTCQCLQISFFCDMFLSCKFLENKTFLWTQTRRGLVGNCWLPDWLIAIFWIEAKSDLAYPFLSSVPCFQGCCFIVKFNFKNISWELILSLCIPVITILDSPCLSRLGNRSYMGKCKRKKIGFSDCYFSK